MFATVWPVLLFLYIGPRLTSNGISHADLVRFMKVRRYTIDIPAEKNGWFLGIQPVKDGIAESAGGAGVPGGTQVTLLIRRIRGAAKVEYFWYSDHQNGGGVVDDPVSGCGLYVDRPEGKVEVGDYIAVGDDSDLQLTPRKSKYKGELRLVLTDPKEYETEQSGEPEMPTTVTH